MVAAIVFAQPGGRVGKHLTISAGAAQAQGAQSSNNEANANAKTSAVDAVHRGISSAVIAPSRWFDSFFSDRQYEAENNKTRLKVRLGAFAEEGRGVGFVARTGLRLELPNTGRRLNLLIGGDADDDSDLENTRADDIREDAASTDSENVVAGFQYFLHRSIWSNVSAVTGIRLSGGEPIGILGARYRYSFPLNSWLARYTQSARWFTKNGFVVNGSLDFDRQLGENLLFRQTVKGAWYEDENGYFYGADFSLRQRLGPTRALSYHWDNQFQTKPNNRLEESNLRLRYRQVFWRDWLKFEVTPQLSFPRDRDFDPTPGIYAGIEISFGG